VYTSYTIVPELQAEILLKFLLTTQIHMVRLVQIEQKEDEND